jgi:hypothetical protein
MEIAKSLLNSFDMALASSMDKGIILLIPLGRLKSDPRIKTK